MTCPAVPALPTRVPTVPALPIGVPCTTPPAPPQTQPVVGVPWVVGLVVEMETSARAMLVSMSERLFDAPPPPSAPRASTSEFELAALQGFEHGATFEGDAVSPKVEQIYANMRGMGYVDFSRDDARVALEEYGHDRYGHDRPVDEIVARCVR